ncbi:MAG: MotA/TolQ/ExbB proton channel family protein [Verrucomicrobiae bacterium]|nr:MotA/TolQ/ExbB proton channel family protein [Verrucomicrobiae bacterium]
MDLALEIFRKGGPIMWPLLLCSFVALTAVIERAFFLFSQIRRTDLAMRKTVMELMAAKNLKGAASRACESDDSLVAALSEGLQLPPEQALLGFRRAAEARLREMARGVSLLDTIITAAPLLGLLGTVTGMIRAFSLVGGTELGAPSAITGGIAEALIATAFGLGIAILSLIPFNFLTARAERFRHELQDAGSALELAIAESSTPEPVSPVASIH